MRSASTETSKARDDPASTSSWWRILDRPFHPFLFAILPVLFLAGNNVDLVTLGDVAVPAGVSLTGAAIVYLAVSQTASPLSVAAVRASVILVWFFAYGHVAGALEDPFAGLDVDRHLVLLPLWTLAAVAVILRAGRISFLAEWTRIFNLLAIGLVAASTSLLVMGLTAGATPAAPVSQAPEVVTSDLESAGDGAPDIYYLVLDRYAESSTLVENHGFDNEPFLGELQSRGFTIPARSLTNYSNTAMALSATLNMQYLDWVTERYGPGTSGRQPLRVALQDHEIGRVLGSVGYRYLHIGSWWEPTRTNPFAERAYPIHRTSEFRSVLERSTVLDAPLAWRWYGFGDTAQTHHQVAERQFEAMDDAINEPGPKFVFGHILLPHPPYVFDASGRRVQVQPVSLEDRKAAYIEQLRFTNAKLLEMVDAMQSDGGDPIIILQSDEGPNPGYWARSHEDWPSASDEELRTKFRVLNALRLPGVDAEPILPTFSSVNTFRVLLNAYFGGDLQLLEDAAFVASKAEPYRFIDIIERVW